MQLPNQTMVPFLAGLLLAGTSAFVAEEMRKRGWYQVQPAEPQKIHEAKTRFTMPQ